MKVRDSHARINGQFETITMPSGGIDILSDCGRILFSIDIKDNVLHISGGSVCKHNGRLLDDRFVISPRASNCVDLIKTVYQE